MNTSKTILKLLYSSSGWLLKFSFFSLPFALFLSISSYLFIENILSSYEKYLVDSYIGVQGRLSVESDDLKLMDDLAVYSQDQKLKYSQKKELKTILTFLGKVKVVKYANFIFLEHSYMKQKFKNQNIKKNTLFVNDVFLNSMGSLDLCSFKKVSFDKGKKEFAIDSIEKIDTGFLNSEPTIFMTLSFGKEIFGELKRDRVTIEFLESSLKKIDMIKKETLLLAKKDKTMNLKINDLILDTKETKEFFHKVSIIENSISLLIFLLSMGIILLSISISIEFKKNSLKTLQLVGMSSRDLAFTISMALFSMVLLTLALSLAVQALYKKLFLKLSGFDASFFMPQQYQEIVTVLLLALVLFFITFYTTKYIFRR